MPKLHGMTVLINNDEPQFQQLKALLDKVDLAHAFDKAVGAPVPSVDVIYSDNLVPVEGRFVTSSPIGPHRVEQERRLQFNMSGGWFLVIEQKGSNVEVTEFTIRGSKPLLVYANDERVLNKGGQQVAAAGSEIYRGLMSSLDKAPEILGFNPNPR